MKSVTQWILAPKQLAPSNLFATFEPAKRISGRDYVEIGGWMGVVGKRGRGQQVGGYYLASSRIGDTLYFSCDRLSDSLAKNDLRCAASPEERVGGRGS